MVNLSLVHSLYFLWDFLCLIYKIPWHLGQFGRTLFFFFIFQQIFFGGWGGVGSKKCNFIFLLVGSIVVGMPNFSFLEGLEVGFLWWKTRKKNTRKKNNSSVLRATLASAKSLAELGWDWPIRNYSIIDQHRRLKVKLVWDTTFSLRF